MTKRRAKRTKFVARLTPPSPTAMADLSIEETANFAYSVFGKVADALAECGVDHDLAATAAIGLGDRAALFPSVEKYTNFGTCIASAKRQCAQCCAG